MKFISIMNSVVTFLLVIVVSAVVAENKGGSGNNIYITIMDGKEKSEETDDNKVPNKPLVMGDPIMDDPTLRDICLLGPIEKDRYNYCHASILRYTFDVSTGRCNKFIYGGCFGTDNLFRTRAQCEQKCAHLMKPKGGEKTSDEKSIIDEEDHDDNNDNDIN